MKHLASLALAVVIGLSFAACSGDDDTGGNGGGGDGPGAAGDAGSGQGGTSVTGGSAGRGGSGGTGGKSGTGGSAGGGRGGAAGMMAAAGFQGVVNLSPSQYGDPAAGNAWTFQTNPDNSEPPIVLAVDGGVILGGTTSDPSMIGLTSFGVLDGANNNRAYLGKIDTSGALLWAKGLGTSGVPVSLARAADGVVVLAAEGSGFTDADQEIAGDEIHLAKYDFEGKKLFETVFALGDNRRAFPYAVTVDGTGAIYIAGFFIGASDTKAQVMLIKCDSSGTKLWEATSTAMEARPFAVAALDGGDIVLGGIFKGDLALGGKTSTLTSTDGYYSGFLARYTAEGDAVWSSRFGSAEITALESVVAVPGGDFVMAGRSSQPFELSGSTVDADLSDGETITFVSRWDGNGNLRWVSSAAGALSPSWTESGASLLATDGGTVAQARGFGTYLRTFDAETGDPLQSFDADPKVAAASVSFADGALWLSGVFDMSTDLSKDLSLTDDLGGAFVLKLEAQ